jgi:hypothetical protein
MDELDGRISQTTLYAFPAFSSQWSAKPIWDAMQRLEYAGRLRRLKLYLTCLSDEDTLRSVLASVAQYFPHVYYLEFVVHDRDIHLVRIFSSPFQPDITVSNLGYARARTEPSQSVIGSVTDQGTARIGGQFWR